MLKAFAKSIRQAQSIHKLMAYNILRWSIFREQANSAELRSSLSKLERFEQLNVLSLSPESRSNIISRPGSYQSGEFDTLINQHDRAAPIRSPVRGRTGFSESWGLLASVPSLPHPLPAPFPFFSRPNFRATRIFARTRHTALRSYGNACYAGYIIIPFFHMNL